MTAINLLYNHILCNHHGDRRSHTGRLAPKTGDYLVVRGTEISRREQRSNPGKFMQFCTYEKIPDVWRVAIYTTRNGHDAELTFHTQDSINVANYLLKLLDPDYCRGDVDISTLFVEYKPLLLEGSRILGYTWTEKALDTWGKTYPNYVNRDRLERLRK